MQLSWEYIAGFFDGEGCVTTHTNRSRRGLFGTQVSMAQSGVQGRALLAAIQGFLADHAIKSYLLQVNKRTAKTPMWSLVIGARPSVMAFFAHVRGRVIIKKQVVEDTWRFYTIYPSLRGPVTALRNREIQSA